MARARDIIILGAGHNGLVAAFYLAKAGFKPLLLERREVVGGAATTGEFHPGFRCSTLAHACGPLDAAVVRDMQLERHGLAMLESPVRLFAPLPDGRNLTLFRDVGESASQIEKFSKKDAVKYRELSDTLAKMSPLLQQLLAMTPPDIAKPGASDLWNLAGAGRQLRKLGKKDMMRLIRWGPTAVADLASEFFETEVLRAVIAARGIFGAALGPWSAGSTTLLLLRAAGDPHPAGTSAFPRGGMGALAKALANAARQAGAEIRTGADVAQIAVKDGAVTGVVLASGEEISATRWFRGRSAADILKADRPGTSGARIGGQDAALPFQGHRRENESGAGQAAIIHGAPGNFRGGRAFFEWRLERSGRTHSHRSGHRLFGESLRRFEVRRVFVRAISGRHHSFDPRSFAGAGRTTRDVGVHAVRAVSAAGRGLVDAARCARGYHRRNPGRLCPDLPERIVGHELFTPQDLESQFGLTGGHPFHGELALDQIFTMRPLLGYARYRGPVRGLYMCGSGTHPGAG